MDGSVPAPELAQVVRLHLQACQEQFGLSAAQRRVCGAIAACRTAAMGGQMFACDACGASHFVYHSCRNRHCPKCQTLTKERWLAARIADLLPVPYFHLVFTLPHAIHPLVHSHARLIYDLLFQSAAHTLLEFGRNPRWLGGQIGITLVLHTWAQKLTRHVHVHGVVSGGALSPLGKWLPAKRGFLFAVRALSKVFRGKYLDALQSARADGRLSTSALACDPTAWRKLLKQLRQHDWVVYAKRPFAGPEQVLGYLGRYTHKVAISNHRLLSVTADEVAFGYRDRTAHGKDQRKVMRLPGPQFLQRFLLHVLPEGFKRIRHYGLTASRCKKARLDACRQQLNVIASATADPETPAAFMQRVAAIDIAICPVCKAGRLHVIATLKRAAHPFRQALAPRATGPPQIAMTP